MSAPVQIHKPIHRAPPKLPPPMPSPFRSLCWEFRDGWRSGRRRLGWFAPIPGQAWWYRVAYAAGFGVGRAVLWVRGKRPTGEEMEKWGPFRPRAQYSVASDSVFVYLEDEPSYLRRIDPTFGILVSSRDPQKVTGYVVEGVAERARSTLAKLR